MASNKTTNLGLNQWEAEDAVLREDFNADNAKIDAALANIGNCLLVEGSYVGKGTYNSSGGRSLTFERKPLAVFIWNTNVPIVFFQGMARSTRLDGVSSQPNKSTWSGNTLSWYNQHSADSQMDSQDVEYHYLALLKCE